MNTSFSLEKGRRAILIVSWCSIVISLTLGSLLFGFSIEDSSSSAFGFAITAILNACTSFVVVWRYTGVQNAESQKKERKAFIALGLLFLVSSLFTGIKTIYSITMNIRPDFSDAVARNMMLTSAAAALLLGILAIAQLLLALKVDSRILLTDALSSFCGSFVALSIVPSYKIEEYFSELWFLDDISGLIISLFLFVYGTVLIGRMLVKFVPVCIRGSGYQQTE